MIGIAGTKADPVILNFAARCTMRGVDFAILDLLRIAAEGEWSLTAPASQADFVRGDEQVELHELSGIYIRPIPLSRVPREMARWQGLTEGLYAWMEEADCRIVNLPTVSHQINSYKPAHYSWLAENGFLVPPSLLTNRVERLREFLAGGRAVVKPVSGVRATTRELTDQSAQRLATTQRPVLAQRLIEGYDIRVHVVHQDVLACAFHSSSIDYRSDRYAVREIVDVPGELAERLIAKTAEQCLVFAGWDFKVDGDGRYWCLECNPMPGYSYYDTQCLGAISDALIRELCHRPASGTNLPR